MSELLSLFKLDINLLDKINYATLTDIDSRVKVILDENKSNVLLGYDIFVDISALENYTTKRESPFYICIYRKNITDTKMREIIQKLHSVFMVDSDINFILNAYSEFNKKITG